MERSWFLQGMDVVILQAKVLNTAPIPLLTPTLTRSYILKPQINERLH